jgi:hypothetical protein
MDSQEPRARGLISGEPAARRVWTRKSRDAERRGEADGTPYIVMELVDGQTLRSMVGQATVPMDLKVSWLVDVARALAAGAFGGASKGGAGGRAPLQAAEESTHPRTLRPRTTDGPAASSPSSTGRASRKSFVDRPRRYGREVARDPRRSLTAARTAGRRRGRRACSANGVVVLSAVRVPEWLVIDHQYLPRSSNIPQGTGTSGRRRC